MEMTSWVGTSITRVRISTLTICCTNGITRINPGPFTFPQDAKRRQQQDDDYRHQGSTLR